MATNMNEAVKRCGPLCPVYKAGGSDVPKSQGWCGASNSIVWEGIRCFVTLVDSNPEMASSFSTGQTRLRQEGSWHKG